jgi:hypothetical protein
VNVDATTTAVDQMVRRAAVLGYPIEHSLSPILHGAAYQALDLHGWHYDKIECDEAGLPSLVDSMGPEWAGLSLTMPLKRVALTVADEVSPLAQAVGAANTLVFSPGGGRRADNIDVAGMVSALREAGLTRVEQAVILGADGPGAQPGPYPRATRDRRATRDAADDLRRPVHRAAARRRLGHLHAAGRRGRSAERHPLEARHHGA